MASISGRGAKGHHTYTLTLTQGTQSVANNSTTVIYSFDLTDDNNWFWSGWNQSISYSVSANGAVIASGYIPNHTTKTQNIASGSFNVPHNADGTKSISYSFSVSDGANQSYTSGNASASGTMVLSTIARYLSITSLEITNKTENSVVVKWGVSHPRSSTYYSLDNGATWIGSATHGETLASDNKSGSFNLPNLTANTAYNIKVKFRRADNDLWTESGAQNFATYDYPHCKNSPDFVIGDTLTLGFYNPLNRSVKVTIIGNDGSTIDVFNNLTGGSLSGYNAQNTVDNLYKSIPNSQSGRYKVIVSYNGVTRTKDDGNSYRVRGTEAPTINGFNYIDNNAATVNITKNPIHIVQNKSVLKAQFDEATRNYHAGSIVKYVVTCNGKSVEGSVQDGAPMGTVDSGNDVDLTLTVTDSRGLSAKKTIKVTMLAYSKPTAIVTLKRVNNYEDVTKITVDGSIASINGKNGMTIKYQYKVSDGNYGSFVTIADNVEHTVPEPLDKNNVFIFNVVVTDSFGETFSKEYSLGKGVFPLFIDVEKNSVSINKFPSHDRSLEASGFISMGERQVYELDVGASIEIPVFLILCSGLVNFRISGANLEIARLFYLFRSNQYFGIHKTLVDESYINTSAVVPMEMRNADIGYIFKFTNNHSSTIHIRFGVIELC